MAISTAPEIDKSLAPINTHSPKGKTKMNSPHFWNRFGGVILRATIIAVVGCRIGYWMGVPVEMLGLAVGIPISLGYIALRVWDYFFSWTAEETEWSHAQPVETARRIPRSLLFLATAAFFSFNAALVFEISALCFRGLHVPLVQRAALAGLWMLAFAGLCAGGIIALRSSHHLRRITSRTINRQIDLFVRFRTELVGTAEWLLRVSDQISGHRY